MVFPMPLEGLHLPRHLLRKTSVNAPYRHAACKSALIRLSFMSYDLQSEGQHDWTPRKSSLGTRAMLMLCWRWGFGFWSLICITASQRFGIPENVGAWRDVGVLIGINCFTASFSFSWVSARENPNGPQEFGFQSSRFQQLLAIDVFNDEYPTSSQFHDKVDSNTLSLQSRI